MTIPLRFLAAASISASLFCAPGDRALPLSKGNSPMSTLRDVTSEEWRALASRRIFFGHQSVGGNLVQGVTDLLASHPEIPLKVIESRLVGSAPTAGFYHAKVGRNEHPDEKTADFVEIASRVLLEPGSIGMLKFCYVDVRGNTDPLTVFAQYRQRIAALREAEPHLTIVHFTMPLHTNEGRLDYWRLKLRGEDTERARNLVRNQYNQLLRAAYGGREPVFDLAALESTRADGSRSFFLHRGQPAFTLAEELTDDGGHLNASGRARIAEQFLVFLAKLPAGAPHAAAGRS